MAKTSWLERNKKKRETVKKYAALRAELKAKKDYAGLTLPHHYTVWSMTDFLIKTKPDGYAALNDRLHGRTNRAGIADSSNMLDVHREAFKECIGMTYTEFEAAWAKWVDETYTANPP